MRTSAAVHLPPQRALEGLLAPGGPATLVLPASVRRGCRGPAGERVRGPPRGPVDHPEGVGETGVGVAGAVGRWAVELFDRGALEPVNLERHWAPKEGFWRNINIKMYFFPDCIPTALPRKKMRLKHSLSEVHSCEPVYRSVGKTRDPSEGAVFAIKE